MPDGNGLRKVQLMLTKNDLELPVEDGDCYIGARVLQNESEYIFVKLGYGYLFVGLRQLMFCQFLESYYPLILITHYGSRSWPGIHPVSS